MSERASACRHNDVRESRSQFWCALKAAPESSPPRPPQAVRQIGVDVDRVVVSVICAAGVPVWRPGVIWPARGEGSSLG